MKTHDIMALIAVVFVAIVIGCIGFSNSTTIVTEDEIIENLEGTGQFGIINDTVYYLGSGSITTSELHDLMTLSDKYVILVSTR